MTSYLYLFELTPPPERDGGCPICHLGAASILISRLPDGQWRSRLWLTGSGELGGPDSEGLGHTPICAVALSLRGAGAGPEYAVELATALVQLEPVKPFPWFILFVFAPILAAAVVAGVWLILKSF